MNTGGAHFSSGRQRAHTLVSVETIARSVRAGRSAVVESTYHKLVGAAFRWLEAAAKVCCASVSVGGMSSSL